MSAALRSLSRSISRPSPRFIDGYLSYLLARASYVIYKEFDREVRASGLSSLEWRVLATLADTESITIGELAAIVLAKQPTLTKLIDRMEAAGLVAKRDDRTDRRRTLVTGTPRGRRLVAPLIDRAKVHETERLRDFAEADVRALKKILQSLVERADTLEETPTAKG